MSYTNDMRHAVRATGNPTDVDIHISQKGEQVYLLYRVDDVLKLSKRKRADFNAYLKEVSSIIEFGGGGRPQLVGLQ